MVRRRQLPYGWYPDTAAEIRRECADFLAEDTPKPGSFVSVVVPHAGWAFSGRLAARTLNGLRRADTVVVVGGHLHSDAPLHLSFDDAFETPLGRLETDREIVDVIRTQMEVVPDRSADNTVEVQLPLVGQLLSMPRVVCLRCPPSAIARELGRTLAGLAASGRSLVVVGSTDLTHYGPAYRFEPHGSAEQALNWVRDSNDAAFIGALKKLDAGLVISSAGERHNACSAGAAATSAEFAASCGALPELVGYHTSYDVRPSSSFVGYVGLGYRAA